jgi:hypothetical protein
MKGHQNEDQRGRLHVLEIYEWKLLLIIMIFFVLIEIGVCGKVSLNQFVIYELTYAKTSREYAKLSDSNKKIFVLFALQEKLRLFTKINNNYVQISIK